MMAVAKKGSDALCTIISNSKSKCLL